jgi:hypothetical protein
MIDMIIFKTFIHIYAFILIYLLYFLFMGNKDNYVDNLLISYVNVIEFI